MLTDYHVHLRPDEDGTPGEVYFTAANAERYREVAEERGIAELGVAEHIHRFVQSLDIWRHPWYRYWAADDVDEYCDFVRGAGLKLGIEADFLPGREDRVQNMLDGRPSSTFATRSSRPLRKSASMPSFRPWLRTKSQYSSRSSFAQCRYQGCRQMSSD